MIRCKKCDEDDPNKLVRRFDRGKLEYRPWCKPCERSRNNARRLADPKRAAEHEEKAARRKKRERALGIDLDKWIYVDSRRSDRKKDRENNLTRDDIKKIIVSGCEYCGEKKLRMTLDRIDNSKGHVIGNVIGACLRCNYARRSMPYEAWRCLVPGMREAREKGLFGDWTGRCR